MACAACCTALYALFPELRSGKIQTVALPATALSTPLNLTAATAGSTAASNWMGPSIGSSGALSLAMAVALRTLSIMGPTFESPVAYESIATRG
eukprot:5744101-Pleurochrysis_carterae.AAC.1